MKSALKYSEGLRQAQASQLPTSNERGVALIVVVIILALLAILGAVSVKVSRLNQNISKNAQAKKLLVQSSDVPLAIMGRADGQSELDQFMTVIGPMGYLRNENTQANEYVLCYQPMVSDKLYRPDKHRIVVSGGGATGDINGYCKVSDSNSYTSSRKIITTQVSVTRPEMNDVTDTDGKKIDSLPDAFQGYFEGTDPDSGQLEKPIFYRVYSTSVLPTMSRAISNTDIDSCMEKPVGGQKGTSDNDNMRRCLEKQDVPFITQVQDFVFAADPKKQ